MMRIVCCVMLHTATLSWVESSVIMSMKYICMSPSLISPPRTTFSSTPGAGFIITIAPWYESPFWPAREVTALRLSRGHCREQNRSSSALGRTPHSCLARLRGQSRQYLCGRLSDRRQAAMRIYRSVAGRPPAARRLPYKLYGERSIFFPGRAVQNIQKIVFVVHKHTKA